MTVIKEASELDKLLGTARRVLIMQADNPDGDSLGSALALEQIIGDMDKQPLMYCAVDIPTYLRYMDGWDRIQKDIPSSFDLSIMVDVSADSLFDLLNKSNQRGWVASKPCIIIDHHNVETSISYATLVINRRAVATSEVIYELAKTLTWPLNLQAKNMITTAIMSDSLGLTTEDTSARSIEIVSELVAGGVKIAELDNKRRELSRKSPDLVHYKGDLLKRVEYFSDNKVAIVTIPWAEIERYSNEYNPSMLVLDDMRQTTNTAVAVAFKTYNDGRVTAKIRCNYGFGIANELAKHFGGGGHKYASGFRVTDGRTYDEIKSECIELATELINNLEQERPNEAPQHSI